MKKWATLTLLVVALSACSKFEHQETQVEIPSCELCAWADSLEGMYVGNYNYQVTHPYGFIDTIYSAQFVIQHVFLNKGPMDDSTRMYFQVTQSGLGYISPGSSIWVADDSTKSFRNTGLGTIFVTKDSMTMEHGYSQSAFGGQSSYTSMWGVFYKQ